MGDSDWALLQLRPSPLLLDVALHPVARGGSSSAAWVVAATAWEEDLQAKGEKR